MVWHLLEDLHLANDISIKLTLSNMFNVHVYLCASIKFLIFHVAIFNRK